ncbi:TetR/AcrR family transcriptional regulator [Bacillus suaedaesalsae]|uniref:TetR/AcrR family transcriptional regulator n=1 Tax=Bacillus suaedaesalsae TaxID=2810349 RepID=A0ABS2DDQ8_9BACI|nr:TetR/AcrR family transcriptional regulator [Bacillus suaedaesalsae]MBM6616578.1 TetR/AcrR family transcriptional regulator [Bacillus suaedaesalsae]
MNDRKQHVLKKAHQLFTEKGFQATSIQDILEYSGISKGTFYNYFSSKNELLIAIFTSIYKKLEEDRNALLVGQDPSDITIFVKQVNLQMQTNRKNNLITLFEEVSFLNDVELKQAIKKAQLKYLLWIYNRFIELFGADKKPYLLDCAVMFTGILHHNIRYFSLAYESHSNIEQVVQYSVNRIKNIVSEVSHSKEQLLSPDLIESWMPMKKGQRHAFKQQVHKTVFTLKEELQQHEKYIQLIEFIQEELIESKHPRKFLLESTLATLKQETSLPDNNNLLELEQHIVHYFKHKEDRH